MKSNPNPKPKPELLLFATKITTLLIWKSMHGEAKLQSEWRWYKQSMCSKASKMQGERIYCNEKKMLGEFDNTCRGKWLNAAEAIAWRERWTTKYITKHAVHSQQKIGKPSHAKRLKTEPINKKRTAKINHVRIYLTTLSMFNCLEIIYY